ncbi:RNA-binding protein 5-like [Babylonia areolata]|uniref:RNA-binding protein 5-like n=1 Tax=Babylonia areolata TaxID=304850 RepID=UPI003FD2745F
MYYSAPRVNRDSRDQANKMDWMCKCGAHNFKRRDFCYKCNINRRFAEDPLCGVTELDPATHVGKNPCNTLLFRDLDALTTEQGVLQAIAALTSMAIKNTQVIRDDMGTSLCFAFLELNSVASAKQLHDFLQAINPPLAVDGKQVMVSYAKNTYNTSLDIIMKAQQKLAQNQYYLNYNNYYGQQGQDANSQYYNYYYGSQQTTAATTTTTTTTTAPGNSTNAAAAVAQTAIMQAQAAKAAVAAPNQTESQETSQYPVYPPPDVSTYQYDKTSGYYYDPSTGLYYEPNTQYYYNAKTSQWMYWDAEKSTYLPAPTQNMEGAQQTPGTEGAGQITAEKVDKEEKKEKEKTKVAKKIAKDMEKWAKAMNAQKDALKEEQRKSTTAAGRRESAAADAGFAILQKSKEDMKLMPPPPLTLNPAPEVQTAAVSAAPASKTGLVASYGGDSDESGDEEDGVVDESKLVDWSKLACLLCKRQFQSREILTKHTQFSDLHKNNLENLKVKSAGKVEKKEYRDRAKERRQKYGTPAPPEPRKQAGNDEPEVYEQPTKAGIGVENIGNKMLQKMGWTAGLGLGKSNQGRTAPVETQRRAASAGLGARGADIVAEEGATYKENVKKTLFARYNETE